MILHQGIKTLNENLVAYKNVENKEKISVDIANLNKKLYEKKLSEYGPTMIFFYGPKDNPNSKVEIIVPIEKKLNDIKTKIIKKIKAAFIVFVGTNHPTEYYYKKLENHIKSLDLERDYRFHSIEVIYPPKQYAFSYGSLIDEDASERWRTEIMIPIKD